MSTEDDDNLAPSNEIPYEFITVPARKPHTATVIWLHGLGDSGKGMLPYATDVAKDRRLAHIKWILPSARPMSVTGAQGGVMNSWFNILSFDIANRQEDERTIRQAVARINDIVTQETTKHGIPTHRIIIGGISQGSALSLMLALTTERPLAGVFVLSGYVPLRKRTKEIASKLAPTLPIFWAHGKLDRQVEYNFSVQSAQTLASDLAISFYASEERLTAADLTPGSGDRSGVCFMSYSGLGHWMNGEEMDDLCVWIRTLLPAGDDEV